MDKKRNRFVYLAAISVNWMSLVGTVGYPWTSPYIPILSSDSEDNPLPRPTTILENSWIAALLIVGCIFGTTFAGVFDEKLGKKKTLMLFHIPIIVSNVILIFANSVEKVYISRFLLGIGSGCVYSIIPTYIGEICDENNRGSMSMLLNFMLNFATIIVVSIGPYISISMFSILCLIPSILFLLTFGLLIPESPHDLVLRGKLDEAEVALCKLGGTTDVQKELINIVSGIETFEKTFSFKHIFQSKEVFRSLVITVGLIFFQQFSGCGAVIAYQQTIFDSTSSDIPGYISVIIVALVQFIPTIVSTYFIDSLGRKKLLLISEIGLVISLGCLGLYFHLQSKDYDLTKFSWLPLTCLLGYMVFFRLGLAPIPFTIVGEIFPTNLKAKLSTAVIVLMFVFLFFITFAFPILSDWIGMAWTLWTFTGFVIMSIVFSIVYVPETKGKSLLEIQIMLKEGRNK